MVGPDLLLPAKFKGPIKDAVAPSGGQVIETVPVGDASNRVALDKRPIALRVQLEEPLAANVVNVQDKAGVVCDPARKVGELGRLVEMTITGKHGVVRRRDIEGRDINGMGVPSWFDGVPLCWRSGNRQNLTFIDFVVNHCVDLGAGREGFLRGLIAGNEGWGKATIIVKFWKRICKRFGGVEAVVGWEGKGLVVGSQIILPLV
jgi:hypothetical protein